jgi:mannose-1-phosphate guanylyltransferase
MKALILAAGRGTRVAPLTDRCPKPLLPVLGTPAMDAIVRQLARHGFDEIVVNLGAQGEQIERHFGDGSAWGVRMAYFYEGVMQDGQWQAQPMGSAATMREVQRRFGLFDDTFAVVCGDALFDLDLTRMLALHKERGSIASMALTKVQLQDVQRYGIAVVDGSDRVQSFQEKPAPAAAKALTANTGIYLFEPQALRYIPRTGAYDIGGELFPQLLLRGAPVHGFSLPMQWLDIGVLADFLNVNLKAVEGTANGIEPSGLPMPVGRHGLVFLGLGAKFSPYASLHGRAWIAAGAQIGKGVRLVGPVVIGAGCVIEDGAVLTRCVVLPHTRVHAGVELTDAIVQADRAIRVVPMPAGQAAATLNLPQGLSCDARNDTHQQAQAPMLSLVA